MSDLYVDPFYWEFGYAVGDQDLQVIEGDPLTITTSAQGSLGFVCSLSSFVAPSTGAGVNESLLNDVAPGQLPARPVEVTATATLDVVRIFFIAGSAQVEVAAAAALGVTVNAVSIAQCTAVTSAAIDLQVPVVSAVQCAVTVQAGLSQIVNLAANVNAVASTTAAAAVTKPFVASGDAIVNTIAVALLGKRLGGFGSTSVTSIANSAILKAMASSAAVVTSATATAQVGKPFAASVQARVTAQPPLAIGKPFTAVAQAVATLIGQTVLLRLVPVELADRATYDLQYSVLYAEAQLVEQVEVTVPATPTATVADGRVFISAEYTSVSVEAELVEELELEVQW
jgi:hypothetical protein